MNAFWVKWVDFSGRKLKCKNWYKFIRLIHLRCKRQLVELNDAHCSLIHTHIGWKQKKSNEIWERKKAATSAIRDRYYNRKWFPSQMIRKNYTLVFAHAFYSKIYWYHQKWFDCVRSLSLSPFFLLLLDFDFGFKKFAHKKSLTHTNINQIIKNAHNFYSLLLLRMVECILFLLILMAYPNILVYRIGC